MKVFIIGLEVLLMAAIALTLTEEASQPFPVDLDLPHPHPDCPIVDNINRPILLSHPSNCRQYYSCHAGQAYTKTCPDNLYWNQITYRCDYPEVTKCTTGTGSVESIPTSEPAVYQTYVGNCNKFYRCQAMRCPNDMYWNARAQHCGLTPTTECEHLPLVPITTTTSTTPAPTLPAEIPTAATAPSTVTAGSGTTPSYDENVHELDKLCEMAGKHYIPYPGDCHKFIQCNGFAYVHVCPSNLLWNSELLTCDRFCK